MNAFFELTLVFRRFMFSCKNYATQKCVAGERAANQVNFTIFSLNLSRLIREHTTKRTPPLADFSVQNMGDLPSVNALAYDFKALILLRCFS